MGRREKRKERRGEKKSLIDEQKYALMLKVRTRTEVEVPGKKTKTPCKNFLAIWDFHKETGSPMEWCTLYSNRWNKKWIINEQGYTKIC